jgi:hypothetical protein
VSRTVSIDGESYTLPTGSERNWLALYNQLLLALIARVNALDSAAHPGGILYFGAQGIVSSGTSFLYPGYDDAVAATLGVDIRMVMPAGGTLSKLYARHNASTSQAVVYTVRINSADSALACTVAGGATSGNNAATSIAVSAGDRVSISVLAPSTSPTLIIPAASVLFTPTDPVS